MTRARTDATVRQVRAQRLLSRRTLLRRTSAVAVVGGVSLDALLAACAPAAAATGPGLMAATALPTPAAAPPTVPVARNVPIVVPTPAVAKPAGLQLPTYVAFQGPQLEQNPAWQAV